MGSVCRRCGLPHDVYAACGVVTRSTMVGEDEALVGNIVADRYQVREVMGVGTTGTVFATEHVTFARAAAMKVLRPRFADEDLLRRVFHGEARAAWSLNHPCICEVFDIGTLPDGASFFVMERLEGETLATRIGRERLSLAAAVDVMMQLLSAIAAIHARDLLVRDLRPQNIYLAHRRGCRPLVKVLDFGLARLTPLERVQADWDALSSALGPAELGPTSLPYYLSPERVYGEHGVEPASDLFVAGTILYEMLSGERPFLGSSWNGIVTQIVTGAPISLHERQSEITPELSAFVGRVLSADPLGRPASAKDMQDELRAIFEGGRRRAVSGAISGMHSSDLSSTFVSPVAPRRRPTTAPLVAPLSTPPTPRERERERPPPSSSRGNTMATMTSASSPIDPDDRTLAPASSRRGADVAFDDRADRTLVVRSSDDDEYGDDADTETSRLTPEIRAEVEAMQTPPVAFPVSAPQRAKKPPRR